MPVFDSRLRLEDVRGMSKRSRNRKRNLQMARNRMIKRGVLKLAAVALGVVASQMGYAQLSSNVTVKLSGFNSPRGLKFGPDGLLYVAEGGTGGTASTVGMCTQVIPPVGPYIGGFTARISKIDTAGRRQTVVDTLPSSTGG